MINREELPDTLKKWEDLTVRLDQNKRTNECENAFRQGRGRYLYPDNIFKEDKDVSTREYDRRPIRARNMEFQERNVNAGFVKLSDEEIRKRREDDTCFKCNRKGHYSRDCGKFRNFPRQGETRTDTGNREPNMVRVRGIEDRLFPEDSGLVQLSRVFMKLSPGEREDVKNLYNAGQDF